MNLKRRDFIKSASLGAAGAFALPIINRLRDISSHLKQKEICIGRFGLVSTLLRLVVLEKLIYSFQYACSVLYNNLLLLAFNWNTGVIQLKPES
jgi:hypothetical protein